ncbi:integrase [Xanthomonas arboricola pv. fragariae]|nr:integrase [Xanthomonas arboricola pv. fragariae]
MASLLYGSSMRLIECLQLRIKDVDAVRGELLVRDRKRRSVGATVNQLAQCE